MALEFIIHAPSGRELRLPGGARIVTEFGEARLESAPAGDGPAGPDRPLRVGAPGEGEGIVSVGGRAWRARWSTLPGAGGGLTVRIAAERARFPLLLRGWEPGDRIRAAGGTRRLKKLFGEARVPLRVRRTLPVLADAGGAVLWVPGVATAFAASAEPGEPAITLSLADAEH